MIAISLVNGADYRKAVPAMTLDDGSPPCTPDALLAGLEAAGIACRTVHHPPFFTVEEARASHEDLPGEHTKNLFLRNKKGRMWLVTVRAERRLDLKALGRTLGAGRLSFGSAERLVRWLGVEGGSVTPLAVVNDPTGQVTLALDGALLDAEFVNVHPLINTRTTALRPADLVRFCTEAGHPPLRLDLDTPSPGGADPAS